MPELDWNPEEFLECLAEVPEIEDYGTAYVYTATREGITLELTVWPYESVINLSLTPEGQQRPLAAFTLAVRGAVQYQDEKWGESLVFKNCVVVPGRFYYVAWEDVFDAGKYPGYMEAELSVHPCIRLTFT